MIIFEGWGLLVFVFGFMGLMTAAWVDQTYTIGDTASLFLALAVAAVLCFICGIWLNSGKNDKVLVDRTTNEEVKLKSRHSLFFIQIQYWAAIILSVGAYIFYDDVQSGAIDMAHIQTLVEQWSTPAKTTSKDFKTGYEAYKNKQYAEAMTSFSQAADRGEADAQYYLGVLYRDGLGVSKDYAKAMDWFRKAADQGESISQANIGFFYHNAWGVPRDYQKAIIWYQKAADAGSADAQYNLGLMYLNGEGVEKNPTVAANWIGKAASQGNESAKTTLDQIQQTSAASTKPGSGASAAPDTLLAGVLKYRSGRINVVFTDAVPGRFNNGRALTCTLIANIHNNTKYHVNKVSFKIDDWTFEMGEMNANAYVDNNPMMTVSLTNGTICSDQAAFIKNNIKTAAVYDCSMPGIAEGDCQDLVLVSTSIDDAAVKKINDTQVSIGNRQLAPLRQAFAKAGLDSGNVGPITKDKIAKFPALLDTIVTIDSQGWFSNKYKYGSMNNVSVDSQSADGSNMTLLGHYIYNENNLGWVRAKIQNGRLICLQYHDIGDECRPIRLPEVSAQK